MLLDTDPSTTAPRHTPAARDTGVDRRALLGLEGREVSLALADGSRLDAVRLISAGRGRTPTVWIYAGGIDVFVPRPHVIDAWAAA
ncbi:MAG TPA: hypothetical protein VFI47_21050 [Acidimicrobiales bacterium]|nr:hypothetical protein [Acidimicrobiales bacterium]